MADKICVKLHLQIKNLLTRGHIFEKILCKSAFYLRFRQWLNIFEWRIADMAILTQCTLDILCVLSLFFGGKCKLIGRFWELWELAFRMYSYIGDCCSATSHPAVNLKSRLSPAPKRPNFWRHLQIWRLLSPDFIEILKSLPSIEILKLALHIKYFELDNDVEKDWSKDVGKRLPNAELFREWHKAE